MHDGISDALREAGDALIREDERLEDLQLGSLRIVQKTHGFRFGMDAVLLADFARMDGKARVADFGTGTGVLPLLLHGRGKGRCYDAFEIQTDMTDMAARTMRLNGLEDTIRVHCAPVSDAPEILGEDSVDHVVCNPPYGLAGHGQPSAEEATRLARHQGESGLSEWLRAAYRLLRPRGRFTMVYPAGQMLLAMNALDDARLTPKRFRLVYPTAAKRAKLVLIEAVRDARPMLLTEPPLILSREDGSPSDEYRAIYHLCPRDA